MTKGIQFRFNAPFRKVEKKADGSLSVHLGSGDPVDCDILMFATGRVPNTDGLGLEAAGVELNADGAVKVEEHSQSTCPSIYAVGDVTNPDQITPVAIRERQALSPPASGGQPYTVRYDCIP